MFVYDVRYANFVLYIFIAISPYVCYENKGFTGVWYASDKYVDTSIDLKHLSKSSWIKYIRCTDDKYVDKNVDLKHFSKETKCLLCNYDIYVLCKFVMTLL